MKIIFINVGFHGDQYLINLVDYIITKCDCFIETGTNVGSTIAFVARRYPQLDCFSCEPDAQSFQQAIENTKDLSNVSIYKERSQEFIKRLKSFNDEFFKKNILFWIDAHGPGFEWPLREEIEFITNEFKNGYILIDDFKVPGLNFFGYDVYMNQECSFDYIKDSINPNIIFNLYYPNYKERTSQHHPLRGWGLIEFGRELLLDIPEHLKDKIRKNSS